MMKTVFRLLRFIVKMVITKDLYGLQMMMRPAKEA